jgi:hypothetical protein
VTAREWCAEHGNPTSKAAWARMLMAVNGLTRYRAEQAVDGFCEDRPYPMPGLAGELGVPERGADATPEHVRAVSDYAQEVAETLARWDRERMQPGFDPTAPFERQYRRALVASNALLHWRWAYNAAQEARVRPVYRVACPTCGAAPGVACRVRASGRPYTWWNPHKPRERAASYLREPGVESV